MKYLISGGGTGGHIYPALAIAKEIKLNDRDADILYVGTKKGMESELVPKEGIKFKTIRVEGMPRKLNKDSFIALKELFNGLRDSNRILKEFKPDVVIGTGGYVSGPIVYRAKKKKIPAIIHEQNAFPGITNKILSRYVDRVAVTFEEAIKYFKHPEKVVLTGNPIRREIVDIDRESAYSKLNIDKKIPFILSFGGSGGQKKLNTAIMEMIDKVSDNEDIQLIHITGKRWYRDFMSELEKKKIKLKDNIRILPYLYEMPQALNIADIVIASSGAITLAEISAIGVPSILIPKSYTAENHQEYNARAFENKNAAIVILEKDLNGKLLNKTISDLIDDKRRLKEMANNSKKLGNIDATAKIVDIIEELISK
ncbi:MAG: undecaprenyldiphospho-muramoylpentapeptide beta-N-acetylglucosaminyltransferase [Tissierellaceae bacterium]